MSQKYLVTWKNTVKFTKRTPEQSTDMAELRSFIIPLFIFQAYTSYSVAHYILYLIFPPLSHKQYIYTYQLNHTIPVLICIMNVCNLAMNIKDQTKNIS